MYKLKNLLYLFLAILSLTFGCVTPPDGQPDEQPDIGTNVIALTSIDFIDISYTKYTQYYGKTDDRVVTAMLSYSAATISSENLSVKAINAMFTNQLVNMPKAGVSVNYPVRPNAYEMAWYKDFTSSWYWFARKRFVADNEASADLLNTLQTMIWKIQEAAYARRNIK